METIAKQLEISKSETLAVVTERDALKLELSASAEKIALLEASNVNLKENHLAEMQKISNDLKISQDAAEQAVKQASVKAVEIAASAGHAPVASAPAETAKATTTEELWAEFKSIKDMREQAKFYQAHKELWMK